MNILHLDASAAGADTSYSRRASAAIVAALRERSPEATLTRRDLAAEPLPHIEGSLRVSWAVEPDRRTAEHLAAIARSEGLIAELKAADVVVIGAPMYNFSVPSTLKAWIDHVVIAGQTFRYVDGRPQGLLSGKRALLALASGGIYSEGPAAAFDFELPYLRRVLGFIGIADVQAIRVEGVARGPDAAADSLAAAIGTIATLI